MFQLVLTRLPNIQVAGLFSALVARLMAADQAFRDRRALARMPEARLRDMGIDPKAISRTR